VGYDIENLTNESISRSYKGEITVDFYGRKVPKHAHGTANIGRYTSSSKLIMKAVMELFDRIVDKNLLTRRLNIVANHVLPESDQRAKVTHEQLDLFTDYGEQAKEEKRLEKERRIQEATIELRNKFGKNALLKGINLQEGATTVDRNRQIGGHKA